MWSYGLFLPARGAEVSSYGPLRVIASAPQRRPSASASSIESPRAERERRARRERVARAVGVGDRRRAAGPRRRSLRGRPTVRQRPPAALFVHTDSAGLRLEVAGRERLGGVVARADRGVERDARARAGASASSRRGSAPPGPARARRPRRRRRTRRPPISRTSHESGSSSDGHELLADHRDRPLARGVRIDPGSPGRRGPLGGVDRQPERGQARDRAARERVVAEGGEEVARAGQAGHLDRRDRAARRPAPRGATSPRRSRPRAARARRARTRTIRHGRLPQPARP